MKAWEKERWQEALIYTALWGGVFAVVPLVLLREGAGFRMEEMLSVWGELLPFFLLFVVHDLFAAPLLVDRRKGWAYGGVTLLLLALFALSVWTSRPVPPDGPGPDGPRGPLRPEVLKLVIGLLLVGVNLGVKYYLKAARNERRMQALKAENLERQLEALSYQINPHFFMNTLNNIHALVDIDPEQAKRSIEEFSKLMRYVLYEGSRPTIPLEQELDCLRHYVTLMQMRYADSVRIDLTLPDTAPGAEIPPLVLTSFVENAFKHGISYEKPSFVRISVTLEDGETVFRCVNSRQGIEQVRSHGIGLENVRKRLDLLYGERCTLQIDQDDAEYAVLLRLPPSAGTNAKKEGL